MPASKTLIWETTLYCQQGTSDKLYTAMVYRVQPANGMASVYYELWAAWGKRGCLPQGREQKLTGNAPTVANEHDVLVAEKRKKYLFVSGGFVKQQAHRFKTLPELAPPVSLEGTLASGPKPDLDSMAPAAEAPGPIVRCGCKKFQSGVVEMVCDKPAGHDGNHWNEKANCFWAPGTFLPPAPTPKPHLLLGQPQTFSMPTSADKAAASVTKLEAKLAKARKRAGLPNHVATPAPEPVVTAAPLHNRRKIVLED